MTGSRVHVSIDASDRHRWVTFPSLGLLMIAVVMAVTGLPPIDLHGPNHWFGIMDPLCGGTRAARYTVQGHWALAWTYNPLGVLAVLLVGATVLRAIIGVLTHRWVTVTVRWTRRRRWIALTALVVLVIVLEIRQQGRADFLMDGTFTFVDHP